MKYKKYRDQDVINGIVGLKSDIYQYLDFTYREKVINHVRHNSGSREDGEEHYQDVIYEIYLNIKEGRSPQNFDRYFWTVNKFRWIDKLRKKKNALATTSELDGSKLTDANTIEQVESSTSIYLRLILLINRYLPKLSIEEQEYIRLYYYASKPLKVIAKNFGTSEKYARLKLHRIRGKLRKWIHDDPDFDAIPNYFTI